MCASSVLLFAHTTQRYFMIIIVNCFFFLLSPWNWPQHSNDISCILLQRLKNNSRIYLRNVWNSRTIINFRISNSFYDFCCDYFSTWYYHSWMYVNIVDELVFAGQQRAKRQGRDRKMFTVLTHFIERLIFRCSLLFAVVWVSVVYSPHFKYNSCTNKISLSIFSSKIAKQFNYCLFQSLYMIDSAFVTINMYT